MAAARFEIYLVRHEPGGGTDSADGATWRLLSNNNRDLGRAASAFGNVDLCLAAVQYLRRHAADATPVVVRTGRSDWTWRVQVGEVAVAVSSRRYQRRVQGEYACGVFLGLIDDAAVMDAVRLVRR